MYLTVKQDDEEPSFFATQIFLMAVILGIALVSTATLIRINYRKPSTQITLLMGGDSEMVTGMSSFRVNIF